MKKKFSLATTALASLAMVGTLAPVFNTTVASASQSDKSTFSMYIIDDGHGFDPNLFSWELYQDGMGIFEGLVHGSVNGPVAGIASSWKVSNGGLTYTFHLRKNAKFSNGDAITAQDFVFSMRRAVNPATSVQGGGGSSPINQLPIFNAQEVRNGLKGVSSLGVKALDTHTLQIKLSRPDPSFIRNLTLPTSGWVVPLDQRVVESMFKKDWTNPKKIVSDGPYMIASYTPKTQAVLVPNPYYYTKVKLKQITLMYSAGQTGLIDYKSGALDAALLQSTDIPAVEADPTLKQDLHFYSTSVQYSLQVAPSQNTTLLNPTVRKALLMAIDRNVIAQKVLQGTATPAYEYFTPTWLNPWIKQDALGYNPAEARKLLAKAGFPGGKGFPNVQVMVGLSGNQADPVAQAVQQMWRTNLGLNVAFKGEEWGQFNTDENNQLPADTVGVFYMADNVQYPSLFLPTSLEDFLTTRPGLTMGYVSRGAYEQYKTLNINTSMDPAVKNKQLAAIAQKNLPKNILAWGEMGVKAYQTNSAALLKQYYLTDEKNVYDFPIYTPLQAFLIRPDVKGYHPNSFLLTDPPIWLNDVSRG